MNDLTNSYTQIKQEVRDYDQQIDGVPNFQKYSKGTRILFSGLTYQPKFMFIGINPGGGGPVANNEPRKKQYEKQKVLAYSVKTVMYPLAINTRKLFKKAKCEQYLQTAVKSNCFFFATRKETELYQMISHIKHLGVYSKANDWISRLINAVEPEIIICEGKSAFDRITGIYKCEGTWADGVGYANNNGTHIIGYKRLLSHILAIDNVADKIKAVVMETNKRDE
ncbi:hypothetical protein BH09BAC6_BH09BAC6_31940 [soil metagenome]|jgi:hypothetical protein